VSRSARAPFAGGDADSRSPFISRDGSVVVFSSTASDLVPGQEDRFNTSDVFLWDRRTGRTTLVSRAHASRTRAGTGQSLLGGVSADGNVVAFDSNSPGLVARQLDPKGNRDVFLWDRRTGATALVSHNGLRPSRAGNELSRFSSMTPDGAFIAFDSYASDLVLPIRDLNAKPDAFLYERRTGRISLLGRTGGGQPLISVNGRFAAFVTEATALAYSLVLLDRATGNALEIASSGQTLPFLRGLSEDGRWLLLASDAPDLVPGQIDQEDTSDLFLFDRVARQLRLVSHVPGDPLRTTGRDVQFARLSPNGRWAAFQSDSPLLLPAAGPDPILNVFLYDRTTEDAALVSRSASDPGQGGNGPSSGLLDVLDGGIVAFASQASNLVARDFNFGNIDVFVYVPPD
ncbi:MAG TPA: hypothetical protein VG477_17020, partial [Thermoanaerobaculia bacterium]|nr:hypothetical protein [Thermoanaerobaculia bacterium]